jgi:hypothetical protein
MKSRAIRLRSPVISEYNNCRPKLMGFLAQPSHRHPEISNQPIANSKTKAVE